MTNLIDQYLLFRIRAKRDPDAFAELYDRYVTAIYRFVYLKVSSKEKAEDLTSETFLKAWEYVQKQEVKNARALLYQIARNLVIDSYRRENQKTSDGAVVTFTSADASTDSAQDFSDQSRGARQIEARADVDLLIRRIRGLKEDFQDVLMMRLVNDLPFADIADILDKNAGNVRVIYHRALKALEELGPIV